MNWIANNNSGIHFPNQYDEVSEIAGQEESICTKWKVYKIESDLLPDTYYTQILFNNIMYYNNNLDYINLTKFKHKLLLHLTDLNNIMYFLKYYNH